MNQPTNSPTPKNTQTTLPNDPSDGFVSFFDDSGSAPWEGPTQSVSPPSPSPPPPPQKFQPKSSKIQPNPTQCKFGLKCKNLGCNDQHPKGHKPPTQPTKQPKQTQKKTYEILHPPPPQPKKSQALQFTDGQEYFKHFRYDVGKIMGAVRGCLV